MADGDEADACTLLVLLCQRDAYVRKLASRVLSCDPISNNGNEKGRSTYALQLEQSPLFAESGGQPSDQGTLRVLGHEAQGGSGTQAVVIQIESVVWKQGAVYHVVTTPVAVGSEVEVEVDWGRRYDHMQQHTGQHVVSAVADMLLKADTCSWELHPANPDGADMDSVTVDLSVPSIEPAALASLEAGINAEVRACRAVRPLLLDPTTEDGGARIEALRGDPCFRGSLPAAEKLKGSLLRLVEVQGLDINACGGTHLRNTGEVQVVKLVGVERTRGLCRLRFVCGDRALAVLTRCLVREAGLTARLSCGPADFESTVDSLLRERRDLSKSRKALSVELAVRVGRDLMVLPTAQHPEPQQVISHGILKSQAAVGDGEGGTGPAAAGASGGSLHVLSEGPIHCITAKARRAIALHRPAADLDFLNAVAAAALERWPAAVGGSAFATNTVKGGAAGKGIDKKGAASAQGDRKADTAPLAQSVSPAKVRATDVSIGPAGRGVALTGPLAADTSVLQEPVPLLLLTSDASEPGTALPPLTSAASSSLEVRFLLAGPPDAVKVLGAHVAQLLGGRGGGRPGRYQGKGTGLGRVAEAQRAFLAQCMLL